LQDGEILAKFADGLKSNYMEGFSKIKEESKYLNERIINFSINPSKVEFHEFEILYEILEN